MRYLLDSVIVIDHFNGIARATDFLREHGNDCALSVVTRAEVLAGFDADAAQMASGLLDLFPTLPLDADAADRAASLRRSKHLKLPDAFQAAVALQHGLALVTRNTRDFRGKGLPEVLVPYRL
ncbi:MAG: PIN domain-containing protein [Rhodanobacteraceae bacterium]